MNEKDLLFLKTVKLFTERIDVLDYEYVVDILFNKFITDFEKDEVLNFKYTQFMEELNSGNSKK